MTIQLTPEIGEKLHRFDQVLEQGYLANAKEWGLDANLKYMPLFHQEESNDMTVNVRVTGSTKILKFEKNGIDVVPATMKSLTPGSEVCVVVNTPGLWFFDGKIGMTLYVTHAIVKKRSLLNKFILTTALEEVEQD